MCHVFLFTTLLDALTVNTVGIPSLDSNNNQQIPWTAIHIRGRKPESLAQMKLETDTAIKAHVTLKGIYHFI